MAQILKRIAGKFPLYVQQEFKRLHFARQIRARAFSTPEPEFDQLKQWISPGDWVVDVGANIGHYTLRFSELAGAGGRVIALEPVPETFELLTANVLRSAQRNVTLLNMAASNSGQVLGIQIPAFETGLTNFYEAKLTTGQSGLQVLCQPLDSLHLPHAVKLVKIDAEGHELAVLEGMATLLKRDLPVLIVENNDARVIPYLQAMGYTHAQSTGSPNLVFSKKS